MRRESQADGGADKQEAGPCRGLAGRVETGGARRHAFTLVELLVVISILVVLAALQFPALARSERKSQGIQCLNGHRQLLAAWQMYQGDNQDRFPPNANESTADISSDPTWVKGILSWSANTTD